MLGVSMDRWVTLENEVKPSKDIILKDLVDLILRVDPVKSPFIQQGDSEFDAFIIDIYNYRYKLKCMLPGSKDIYTLPLTKILIISRSDFKSDSSGLVQGSKFMSSRSKKEFVFSIKDKESTLPCPDAVSFAVEDHSVAYFRTFLEQSVKFIETF